MSLISRKVFSLKNVLFRSHAVRFHRQLDRYQYMDSDALAAFNWKKRIDILDFAAKHTVFYRRFLNIVGIERASALSPDTYCQLPIVTRKDLKNHFNDFIADNANSSIWVKATTGGSTGSPVTVLHDRRVPEEAAWWRVARWWGVDPSDDIAFIYRLRRSGLRALANELMWWPTRRLFLDASLLTQKSMSVFAKQYNSLRPAIIEGYVGGVYEFAVFCRNNGIYIHPPRVVWVTAAPITESQRTLMQTVFGAPVYDEYGSCEINWIACECKERNGLHLMSDIRHIDIVDDKGDPVVNGEWGRLLVTDLENRVFPLIRYEIGDRGRFLTRRCPCGVNHPLIDKVRGRISDMIRLPGGGTISGEFLTTIFDDNPDAVISFQIRQAADYSIILYCVLGPHPNAKDIATIVLHRLISLTNSSFPITLSFVKEIPHDRGKTRFIVSDLS